MDYIIDANVLMSIIISGKAIYKPLLNYYNFILPEFALVEIDKYKEIIFEKTKMQKNELINFSYSVFSEITILPNYVMDKYVIEKAVELTKSVDIKDVNYIALSMQLDLILLTRDKKLITGVKKKKFNKIMLFDDFLKKI
ncbi:MAG: DNA-binding protein [Candidatus Cloacimonetes bacterium]|nr:DNA-binding protein [Candidatus Cloacimonadota bacterium]